ncbi:MAG: cation:proton antiporter [Fimbriimonadaceae bacterium]
MTIESLIVLLGVAAVAVVLAKWLKLPSIPLFVICGLVLSTTPLRPQYDALNEVLLIGLTFLVFLGGTQLSPHRLHRGPKAAILAGLVQYAVLGLAAFAACRTIGVDVMTSLYIAAAVGISSTLVVVRILQQRRQLYEPFGQFALGILLVQDLVVVFILAMVTHLDAGWSPMLIAFVSVVGLFLASWLARQYVVPRLMLSGDKDEETQLVLAFGLAAIFIGASVGLGLHFVIGAFFAGFALSSFPTEGLLKAQFSSLADFFLALFFVALGALISWPSASGLILAGALILLLLILTPLVVTAIGEHFKLTTRRSVESGILLSQTSELSLVVAFVGFQAGKLSNEVVNIVVMVTIVTMMLTPFLANDRLIWLLTRLRPSRTSRKLEGELRSPVLLLGAGVTGQELLEKICGKVESVVVVDEDPGALQVCNRPGVATLRGDAADPRVLEEAGFSKASIIISTLRDVKDNEAISRLPRKGPLYVRVFEEEEERRVREAGAIPVQASRLAAEAFAEWYHSNPQLATTE